MVSDNLTRRFSGLFLSEVFVKSNAAVITARWAHMQDGQTRQSLLYVLIDGAGSIQFLIAVN